MKTFFWNNFLWIFVLCYIGFDTYGQEVEKYKYELLYTIEYSDYPVGCTIVGEELFIQINKKWIEDIRSISEIKEIVNNGRSVEFYLGSLPKQLDVNMKVNKLCPYGEYQRYSSYDIGFSKWSIPPGPLVFNDCIELEWEYTYGGSPILVEVCYDLYVYPFFNLTGPSDPKDLFACKANDKIKLILTNSQLYEGEIALQVRNSYSGWVSLNKMMVEGPNLHLSYSDLPVGYDWYNKVLQFRVVQPDGTYSNIIGGYAFLNSSTFEIGTITPPTCQGSYDGITIPINNLPASTVNTQLRYTIIQLSESDTGSGYYEDTQWYIADGLTNQIDIPPGATSITLTNESFDEDFSLTPGKYSIEISYKDGSASSFCKSYKIFDIPDIAPLELKPVFPEYSESGGVKYHIPIHEGSITINGNVTGNQGNYSLFYQKNGSSPQLWSFNSTEFSAGNYVFYVTDENGCQSSAVDITLTQPEPVLVLVNEYSPRCNPLNPSENATDVFGRVTFTVTGGIPGFSAKLFDSNNIEKWSSNVDFNNLQQQINDLSSGVYIIKIWDQGNQDSPVYISDNIIIEEADPIELSINKTDVKCNGNNNGVIKINVIGNDNENFGFTLNNGIPVLSTGGYTFNNLGPNNYVVYCQNSFGCIAQTNIIPILEPAELRVIEASAVSEPTCSANDGSIQFSITGGRANAYPYTIVVSRTGFSGTITLSEGANLSLVTIDNLSAGTYSIKVTNSDGCVATTSEPITLNAANPLEGLVLFIENASCTDIPDGSVAISNPGLIQGNYTFASNPSVGTLVDESIDNLASGSYIVTITETTGRKCKLDKDITIGVISSQVQLLTPATTPAYCSTAENGTVLLSATGSKDTGYWYSLDGENYQLSGLFTGLIPGNYVAHVKDKVGCGSSVDFTVSSDPEPVTASVLFDEARCATSSDGRIILNDITYNSIHSHEMFFIDVINSNGTRNEYNNVAIPENYSIIGLKPDSYIVELRDGHNCRLNIPVTISHKGLEPQITDPNFLEQVACEEKTNAKANVVINHTLSYSGIFAVELFEKGSSVSIQNQTVAGSGKTVEFNNLGHKSYIIKATDDQQCSVSLEFIPDYIDQPLKLQDVWSSAPCLAGNGMVTVSATGGLTDGEHGYLFSLNGIPISNGAKAFSPGITGRVLVQDKYGCSVYGDNKTITVRQNPLTINNVKVTNPLCAGESNGVIIPEMQWLPDVYTYNYQLFRSDMGLQVYKTGFLSMAESKIIGLPSGVYDIVVNEMDGGESNNCSSDYPGIELKDPDPFSIMMNHNYIKAKGDNSGVCNIALNGGSGRFIYQLLKHPDNVVLNDGESDEKNLTFDKLYAGSYVLKISDMAGCLSSNGTEWLELTFEIKEPSLPLGYANEYISNVSCNGLTNGSIEVLGQGGWGTEYRYALSGPVVYNWQASGAFKNLTAGAYEVAIRDTAGVVYQWLVEISEPLPFILKETAVSNITCLELTNGSIKVETENGVFADNGLIYRIFSQIDVSESIVDGYSNNKWTYSSLASGSYLLMVTDKNECSVSRNFEITEPKIVVIELSVNTIPRKNDNTGVISAVITGGNQFFDYRVMKDDVTEPIASGQTNGSILVESLYAGNYTVLVKDTANCNYEGAEWMERQITIHEPESSLMFVIDAYKPVSCNGFSDGELHIKGVGGWGNYQFRINQGPFSGQKSFTGLAAGDYLITIRDNLGITWESLIKVEEPEMLTAAYTGKTDVACYGTATGTISYSLQGGTPDYQLSADGVNWQAGNTITNLPFGNHTVIIRDVRGCTVSGGMHSLSQASELVLVGSSITESACTANVGAITAQFAGGSGGFIYRWYKDVVDENNQYATEVLEYSTASIQNLYSGRYLVIVEDGNACQKDFEFFVPDNSDLSISTVSTTPVTCFGYNDGTAHANVMLGTAPYSYSWSNEIEHFNDDKAWQMAAGIYRLIVRDINGCVAYKEFEIATPDEQNYLLNHLVQPLCYGGAKGEISLSGTGGTQPYTYSWSSGHNGSVLSNANTGAYKVTISDTNGCSAQFDFDLSYQKSIMPDLGNDTLICHYNPLKLDAGAFNTCNWQSPNGFISTNRHVELNQAGVYYLTVTDNDNCIGADTLLLQVSKLDIDGFVKKDVSCYGSGNGSAEISVLSDDGNYDVLWFNGITTLDNQMLSGGSYWVKVTNTFGCERMESFTISEPSPLSLTSTIQMPYCVGVDNGSISAIGNGGTGALKYSWLGGQTVPYLQNLSEGKYILTLTDANNCSMDEVYHLNYINLVKPDLGNDRTICKGNSIYLFPGKFENYAWRNEQLFLGTDSALMVSQHGVYTVEVDNEDGCYGRDTVVLDINTTAMTPSFLAASIVPKGDTLLVVEVSQPKPVKIGWLISGAHKVVEEGEYHCKVVFQEEGSHFITLSSYTNDCVGETRKSVFVVPAGKQEGNTPGAYTPRNNLLKLTASPNPSNGYFTATLKLTEAADVTFYLVRIDTGQVYETRKRSGLNNYNESFSHTGVGVFALFAESEGERLVVKIIMY